jgi:hypothetical protein
MEMDKEGKNERVACIPYIYSYLAVIS